MNSLNDRFTAAEARRKIGRRVRTTCEWAEVPTGTTGIVQDADRGTVAIDWELNRTSRSVHVQPLRDWFTKGEYTRFLKEL